MMKKLADEIKQKRPFDTLEAEALLNLQRTADQMRRGLQQTLKDRGLTEPQYNVLRILRGAEPDGLPCSEIGKRMISHDPDITRLLRRLGGLRLVERRRDRRDRRVVFTRISKAGLQQLKDLDPAVKEDTRRALGHMTPEKLVLLIDLLEEARANSEAETSAVPVQP
jgi:DNA-binding MarR family transcriptional regulator